ncbi:hypothetical protein [Bacillus sp. 03113]|uniref:YphA family membrane protein n=1 Tax=Bacillus sp. 03113 TaxID=2578211 RepID=UPI001144005B|nr:hypothetical protein [Bacillus sp. 03113]
MEGVLFYWFSWIFWVVTTFFYNKENPNRYKFSFIILMLISLSGFTFSIGMVKVTGAVLFLLFVIYIESFKLGKRKIFLFFMHSFIIMIFFVAFHLIELYDPIWFIFNRNWMLSLFLVVLAAFLEEERHLRILVLFFGSIYGDFFYRLILKNHSISYTIGSLSFLDILTMTSILFIAWNGLYSFISVIEKHFNQREGEKHKLT